MVGAKGFIHIGQKIKTVSNGDIEVIDRISDRKVLVRFVNTGFELETYMDNVRTGKIKDKMKPRIFGVGFEGSGKHKPTKNKKISKEYSVWMGMMRRCYDREFQKKKQPSYIGCTVCEEWHNFQNFAEWYKKNYPNDGEKYELDKDIKVDGNKIYSPDTCIFAKPIDNHHKAHLKTFEFLSPEGVVFVVENLVSFCRDRGLDHSHMCAVHRGKEKAHKGWSKSIKPRKCRL